jgi:hypothetical protein
MSAKIQKTSFTCLVGSLTGREKALKFFASSFEFEDWKT